MDDLFVLCVDCRRDMTAGEPHTADCPSAITQDHADGDHSGCDHPPVRPTFALWGGGEGEELLARDRKPSVWRPCECGCDERDGPVVGYLTASRGGLGITIFAPDEETYQRMLAVFGEEY